MKLIIVLIQKELTMKNKYKIGDLVIGNDTLGIVRNHVGVVEYISECYPTRQDQKNDTNKDIVYHVKFGSYGNFLLKSNDFLFKVKGFHFKIREFSIQNQGFLCKIMILHAKMFLL